MPEPRLDASPLGCASVREDTLMAPSNLNRQARPAFFCAPVGWCQQARVSRRALLPSSRAMSMPHSPVCV